MQVIQINTEDSMDLKIEKYKAIVNLKNPKNILYRPESYVNTTMHINRVLELVCRVLEVNIDDVKSRKRNRDIVEVRQIYSLLILNFSTVKVTKTAVGEAMEKDHATVIHCVKQCLDLNETNIPYRKKLDKCIIEFTKEFTGPEHYILDFNNIPQY